MTLCTVAFYRRFEGMYCLHLQGRRINGEKQPEDGGTLLWIVGKRLKDYAASHCTITAVRTSNLCIHCSFIDNESLLFDTGLMESVLGLQVSCFHVNFLSTVLFAKVLMSSVLWHSFFSRIPKFRMKMILPSSRLKCVRMIYYFKRNDKIKQTKT